MKKLLLYSQIIILLSLFFFTCDQKSKDNSSSSDVGKEVLKVPSQFTHIADAVREADIGDTIIISPGEYHENKIDINKLLTISSKWKLTGDTTTIDKTSIDAGGETLFNINTAGVEISGLKIMNGDHVIEGYKNSTIIHNHIINDKKDGISLEGGGGGYIAYNLIENCGDDGIDLDINQNGSDVTIKHNTIIKSRDDGMEIRLFKNPHQNIRYEVNYNKFIGSRNAGIQLISYNVKTGKVFNIHHNIFRQCKVGLGCMADANTVEDLKGTSKMDERVYFYNNTLTENKIAVTGGNNVIAVNNVIFNNTLGGFKRFGENSAIFNNLFFENNKNFIAINASVTKKENLFNEDPILKKNTLLPKTKSPCIDKGIKEYCSENDTLIKITQDMYKGSAPDLGAKEVK